MKNMRKYAAFLSLACILLCLALFFSACGGGSDDPVDTQANTSESAPADTTAGTDAGSDATEEANTSVSEETGSAVSKVTYTITVKDQDGNPVKDVDVQMCKTSGACLKAVLTDANGVVTFTYDEDSYYVTIVGCPEGYSADATAKHNFADGAKEMTITIQKDATATEAPATQEPATQEPATQEPATQEPATQEPATQAPATEAPTDEPATEAPAPYIPKENAAAGMVNHSFDTFMLNGNNYFEVDGNANMNLEMIDNTITIGIGEAHDSITFRGWIGFAQPIKTFGYVIDGQIVAIEDYNSVAVAPEPAVIQLAGEHATRFVLTVPTADLGTGTHTIGALMQLEDDTIVLFYEITMVIEGLTVDETYPHHANIDWINYEPGMVVGVDTFSATGHSTLGAFTHTIDASVTELNILENATLTLGGWMGVDGGVNRYVYSVNGGEWMDAVGGRDGEPLPGHYEGSGFMDALKNGMFQSDATPASEIVADLSAYAGQTVDVAFAAVCEAEQLTVVPVITILSYAVPVLEIETEAPATEAPTDEPATEAPAPKDPFIKVVLTDAAGNPCVGVSVILDRYSNGEDIVAQGVSGEDGIVIFDDLTLVDEAGEAYEFYVDVVGNATYYEHTEYIFAITESTTVEIELDKAPDGSEAAPFTSLSSSGTISIPANGSVWYALYEYSEKVITINNAANLIATASGIEYTADANGVLTIPIDSWVTTDVSLATIDGTAAEVAYTYAGAPGSASNPLPVESIENLTFNVPAGKNQYFVWTATSTGILSMSTAHDSAALSVLNYTTDSYSVDVNKGANGYLYVTEGDVVRFYVSGSDGSAIAVDAAMVAAYTADAPLNVNIDKELYFSLTKDIVLVMNVANANGYTATFTSGDYSIGYNNDTTSAEGWNNTLINLVDDTAVVSLTTLPGSEWGATHNFYISFSETQQGGGDEPSGEVTGSGTAEDPFVITASGDYAAQVEANGVVIYGFTVPVAGTVTLSTNDGNAYISMQGMPFGPYADAIFQSGEVSMTVEAGTSVRVVVCTHDYAADTIEFSISFPEGEGGDTQGTKLPFTQDFVLNAWGSETVTIIAPATGTLKIEGSTPNASIGIESVYGYEWIADGYAELEVVEGQTYVFVICNEPMSEAGSFSVTFSMDGVGGDDDQGTKLPFTQDFEINAFGEEQVTIIAPATGTLKMQGSAPNASIGVIDAYGYTLLGNGYAEYEVVAGETYTFSISNEPWSEAGSFSITFSMDGVGGGEEEDTTPDGSYEKPFELTTGEQTITALSSFDTAHNFYFYTVSENGTLTITAPANCTILRARGEQDIMSVTNPYAIQVVAGETIMVAFSNDASETESAEYTINVKFSAGQGGNEGEEDYVDPENGNVVNPEPAGDTPNANLANSSLTANGAFNFVEGSGSDGCVVKDTDENGSADQYALAGENKLVTEATGKYAFDIDIEAQPTLFTMKAAAFVRGVEKVAPAAQTFNVRAAEVLFEDGGIYANIVNGYLRILIKGYDGDYTYATYVGKDASKLSFADNGQKVFISVDGKLYATIELSGETDYDGALADFFADATFATKAIVTLNDYINGEDKTETIWNTLVSSHMYAQVGIVADGGLILFNSVKLDSFATVEIPEDFAEVLKPEPGVMFIQQEELNADGNSIADADSFDAWNKIINMAQTDIQNITEIGWAAFVGDTYRVGYRINGEVVYDERFATTVSEDEMQTATDVYGANNAIRFTTAFDTSLLKVGKNDIEIIIEIDGDAEKVFILRNYTINVYELDVIYTDSSKVTANGSTCYEDGNASFTDAGWIAYNAANIQIGVKINDGAINYSNDYMTSTDGDYIAQGATAAKGFAFSYSRNDLKVGDNTIAYYAKLNDKEVMFHSYTVTVIKAQIIKNDLVFDASTLNNINNVAFTVEVSGNIAYDAENIQIGVMSNHTPIDYNNPNIKVDVATDGYDKGNATKSLSFTANYTFDPAAGVKVPEGTYYFQFFAKINGQDVALTEEKVVNVTNFIAPKWNGASFDHQRYLDANGNRIGQAFPEDGVSNAKWNNTATIEMNAGVKYIQDWGWAAYNGNSFQIGYVIDDGTPIYDASWTHAIDAGTHNVISGQIYPGSQTTRYLTKLDISGLSAGNHNIKLVFNIYGEAPTTYHVIKEYTLNKRLTIDWTKTTRTGHHTELHGTSNDFNGFIGAMKSQNSGKDMSGSYPCMHAGAIYLGKIDLSQYSKAFVSYTMDGSTATKNNWNATQKRISLTSADSHNQREVSENIIISKATNSFPSASWKLRTIEIPLTTVTYNGDVYLTIDYPEGTFIVFYQIWFE